MKAKLQIPETQPGVVVFPGAVVLDMPSVELRIDRMRTWPEGVEFTVWLQSRGRGSADVPMHALLRRRKIFVLRADEPPARRFGRQSPQMIEVKSMAVRELHLSVDDGTSQSRCTVEAIFWLPGWLADDAVDCELVWPDQGVAGAQFRLEIGRWTAETPVHPPNEG